MSTALHTTDAGSLIAAAPAPASAVRVPRLSVTLLRTQSDARLTRLAAGGYDGAFEELVRRYRSPLQGYGRRFLPQAAAEDVVQQAFIDLWARLAAGQQIRDVRPWLYRVVHNAALNTIRRGDYRCDQLPEIVASDSPDVAFERKAELREALAGVAALPVQQRQAMVLRALSGHSRAQIAAAMGVSDGAVGQMLHRARVSVRAAMSAVVPWPLAAWAAGVRRAGSSSAARVLGTAGAGGGPAGILVKGGATLAVIAAATAAPLVVKHVEAQPGSASVATVRHAALPSDRGGVVNLRAAQLPDQLSVVASAHLRDPGGDARGGAPSASSTVPGGAVSVSTGEPAAGGSTGSEAAPQAQAAATESLPPTEATVLAEPSAAPAEPPPATESPEASAEAAPPGGTEAPPAEAAEAPPAEASTPADASP
jgi:RNA polymerase sigma factor (sigma-70 family)